MRTQFSPIFRPKRLLTLCMMSWILMPHVVMGEGDSTGKSSKKTVPAWHEDFTDPVAYLDDWVPYGRLANGQWAQGVKGHWRDSQSYARSEWWQVIDGTLHGQNFPDEKHPAGISRPMAGECVRIELQMKLSPGSTGIVRVFGKAVGNFPAQKTDNHVTALNISEEGLHLWHGARLRDPDISEPSAVSSTEAKAPSKERFHNTVTRKKSEHLQITPDAWHHLVFEVRGNTATAAVDEEPPLTFLLEVAQPIESLSFEVDGNKREIGSVWLDEISVRPGDIQ